MMKRLLIYLFIFLVLFLLAIQFYLKPRLPVINGYSAHMACSCYYLANRSFDIIQKEDLGFSPINLVRLNHDEANQTVSSTFFGMGKKTAVYKKGLGCMLLRGEDDYKIESLIKRRNFNSEREKATPFVFNDEPVLTVGIDHSQIKMALNEAFDKTGEFVKKTRAMVVIHKDTLVAEQYAPGIDKTTPLIGWSMTKSITNAIVGIMVKEGKLKLTDKYKEEAWRDSVSLHDLLQMNSGIDWVEEYDRLTHATTMLYDSEFSAEEMIHSQTAYEPGKHWYYSSGTTNYISKIIKETLANELEYQNYPYQKLADKIGAQSFIMEMDESGHYIMSSYGYASARDWAKFGLPYLNDGIWNGDRILPENWVAYSTEVNKASEDGQYGAHLWLNTGQNYFKDAPEDIYFFSGFQGQKLILIPSRDLLVVRLGTDDDPGFDMNKTLALVLKSMK